MRLRIFCALIALSFVVSSGSLASAAPLAPPVECWIENHTPSVPVGGWAQYTVHASGGTGTYAVTLSFGDGNAQQGTYNATEISFSHVFSTSGTFRQTANVSGVGSSTTCSSSTTAY